MSKPVDKTDEQKARALNLMQQLQAVKTTGVPAGLQRKPLQKLTLNITKRLPERTDTHFCTEKNNI